MAIKSSINTATINRSVGSFKQSLNNAQKSAGKVNSSILQRNKFKKESISKSNSLFILRRSAVRRKESEDLAEASSALGVRKAPSRISSGSTRSFFGRMMDISGALLAGWLVGNLPNIINLAEATSRRAVEVARVLRDSIGSFTQILNTLFTGLTSIGASLLRGDIASIPNKLANSVTDMQNSFFRMYLQLEDAYKVLTRPLDFSDDIDELRGRLGLEVPGAPGETPGGTPGTGGRLQPIHKKALDIISGPESGGNYNAMNRGKAGDSPEGPKHYFGKNLTDMTIGEVKRLQSQGKLNAAGRYQIVGVSLPTAQSSAGLTNNDKFDQDNQDLLGIGLLKAQGPGAWSAYSRYTKEEISIMYKAKNTPLGTPTATVQPGTKYTRGQDITGIIGAKGTPSVIISSLVGDPRKHGPHKGLDIATDNGVYIALRANGVVVFAGTSGDYGLVVDMWIESYGVQLRMAHCSDILPNCKVGATIPAGVSFARVGSTGSSTGPHIHFEADTKKGGRNYGGNTPPDPYVALLLLTSRQSNGFKGVTSSNGKPLAQVTSLGTGGGPPASESLTPKRRGQTVIITQPQTQATTPPPSPDISSTTPIVVGESLNSIHNRILLTQLAYT